MRAKLITYFGGGRGGGVVVRLFCLWGEKSLRGGGRSQFWRRTDVARSHCQAIDDDDDDENEEDEAEELALG